MIRALLSNPRRCVKTLLGRDFYLQIDTRIAHERFGSDYGGWNVVTGNLHAGSIVYSFGVGEDASFDVELIQRFGMTVHAFDPTPASIVWANEQALPPQFIMHPYGLATVDGDVTFYPPENSEHVSHTMLQRQATGDRAIKVPVRTLANIMRELGHETVDVLKMDIEGAEYEVLDALMSSEVRPRQVLVEFHHRFTDQGIAATTRALNLLKTAGYRLFSVSATVEEFCFIR